MKYQITVTLTNAEQHIFRVDALSGDFTSKVAAFLRQDTGHFHFFQIAEGWIRKDSFIHRSEVLRVEIKELKEE